MTETTRQENSVTARRGTRVRRPEPLRVDPLLDSPSTKVVVCCGSGGVGKTTTAAALALRAAERGRKTVVLTIDPARRLAQSLGLRELGNHPSPVRIDPGAAGGSETDGALSAMMLDMRRTFDEMVRAHAGPERAEAILANPFYQTVSSSFSGTQEYMAMEKLGQLVTAGDWDLVVVDTPPSRSALDFLDAPLRLGAALDGRVIRLLSAPARAGGHSIRRLIGTGFGIFTKAISTVVGGQLLADASAFVQAFDSMFGGFRERAESTYRLLRSPGTAFLVVATPEPDAMREASYFVDRLSADRMPLAGMVANRTHPVLAPVSAARALTLAGTLDGDLDGDSAARAAAKADVTPDAALAAGVLRVHADRIAIAEREKRMLARFTGAHPSVAVVGVPALPTDVYNLDGLREIGKRLAGE